LYNSVYNWVQPRVQRSAQKYMADCTPENHQT
jgi:hypothetical protein